MDAVDSQLVADWQRRFQVARQLPEQGTCSAEPLSQRFRELTQRTREIHRSKWVRQPSLVNLQQILQLTLGLTKILLAELPHVGDVRWAAFWTELANLVDQRLTRIERQISTCELLVEGAERLQVLAVPLYLGTESSGLPLWNFAHEWHQVLREQEHELSLIMDDAAGLAATLTALGWKRADVSLQSVLTARLIASLTPESVLRDDETLCELIAAAFMQDLGIWNEPDAVVPTASLAARQRRHNPAHPGMGAAILSGLTDLPAHVSLLVGTHHERMDGTGYPQRLSGTRFRTAMHWLAITVRFVELLTDSVTQHMALSQNESQLDLAALRLWREVRRGAFAERWGRLLLDGVQPGLCDQISQRFIQHQSRLLDTRHDIPAPRNVEPGSPGSHHESVVQPPAFLRRRFASQSERDSSPRIRRRTPQHQ